MSRFLPIIYTPRPVDTGDTKWRRLLDKLLRRSDLRRALADAKYEIEIARDRSYDGASAAHEGVFKIEDLLVTVSVVTIEKDRHRTNRTARVAVVGDIKRIHQLALDKEVVSYEGVLYIIDSVDTPAYYTDLHEYTLVLKGIVRRNPHG